MKRMGEQDQEWGYEQIRIKQGIMGQTELDWRTVGDCVLDPKLGCSSEGDLGCSSISLLMVTWHCGGVHK